MYRIIGANQKEYGPVSPEQLRQWVTEGRVNAQILVLTEGSSDWKALGTLPEFSLLLGVQTVPPPGNVPPSLTAPRVLPRTNPLALTGMVLVAGLFLIFAFSFGLWGEMMRDIKNFP
jgi:hypothetical protein